MFRFWCIEIIDLAITEAALPIFIEWLAVQMIFHFGLSSFKYYMLSVLTFV